MKIIIAGSRALTGEVATRLVREALIASGWHLKLVELVSGGADGIDAAGEAWADLADVPVKRFLADWGRYGPSAGPRRNGEMAAYSDALIAIPHPNPKRRRGTNDMIRKMQLAGKPVYVHKGD